MIKVSVGNFVLALTASAVFAYWQQNVFAGMFLLALTALLTE